MKLTSFRINGFRSIESTTLDDCGGFNVIIGKNNAGKSNILLALNSFFSCLEDGVPVSIEPRIGKAIDHFENRDEPIELSLTFNLSADERDRLVSEIVSEVPQVKNSAETLDATLILRVIIVITSTAAPFAFVREVVATSADGRTETLLRIPVEAAEELTTKARRAAIREQEARYLGQTSARATERLDADEWERIKSAVSRDRGAARYLITGPEVPPSPDIQAQLQRLISTSETLSAFTESVKALAASITAEADALQGESLKTRIETFSGDEESVPDYATKILKQIASLKVLYLTERREPIGRREAARLLDLKIRRGGPEKLRNIQQTVSALLGVDIDAFRADSSPSGTEQGAEMDVDRFLVQVNGAGIREALRLILDYEFERPDILLVEEPEIHLHPALETSMMRYLKTVGQECQIFITTHSTNFLDTAEMRNVYLASRNESTTVQLLSMADAEESIPRELGIRLSSLFMFDRLVFVEGPSDEDVIREWASTLEINFSQANVGFVSMDGVRNFAHYATEKTIAFLSRRQVKLYFVLDRDERDDTEIKRLTDRLGRQANVTLLNRREIENYLLNPRAIAEFIVVKQQFAGNADVKWPSVASISDQIAESAEKLKSFAIEKRISRIACKPVYPDRDSIHPPEPDADILIRVSKELSRQQTILQEVAEKLPQIAEREAESVNANWQGTKLDIVPGDLLLDDVCRAFGVRFVKERDASRLASLMRADEIADDIKQLLRRIVT
jgi:putative ATP-dependent endonuclease of the OLD family